MSHENKPIQTTAGENMPEWRELTPEEWQRIAQVLPSGRRPGRQCITDQQMVNALLYRYHTRTYWRDMPEEFGPWTALVKRFTRWRDNGTLKLVFEELEKMGLVAKDSTAEEEAMEKEAPLEWWELTDEQWEAVAQFLPPDPYQIYGHSRYKTNRQMLNALLYREYTKTSLRKMPPQFGHWMTIHNRYMRWQDDGTLQRVFEKLKELDTLSEDKYSKGEGIDQSEDENREWWELTDEQWKQIAPLLPPELHQHGKKPKTNRQMLNAILCRYKTDTAWRELPEKYGHWRTVNDRYTKWRKDSTLQRIFDELEKMGVL